MKKRTLLILLMIGALLAGGSFLAQSETWTKRFISSQDIRWWDGITNTFTATASDGKTITLNKIGNEVNVAEVYGSLSKALTALGTTNKRIITLKPQTWTISANTTIPANLTTKIPDGAVISITNGATLIINGPLQVGRNAFSVATGCSLTINGPIEAGPYQIFSWSGTGAIDLRQSPTERCYLQWWGATECSTVAGDITAYLLKAYQSLDVVGYGDGIKTHDIVITAGLWRIATPFEYVPAAGWTTTNHWLPNLVGDDQAGSVLYMDVGSVNDGITIGGLYDGSSRWIQGTQIKNLTVLGAVGGCRHAFYLACWNSVGGMDNVNLMCGSAASAVFATSCENSHWNIRFGPLATRYGTGYNSQYAGFEAAPVTGVGYETGLTTMAYMRVHSTFADHMLFAIKLVSSGGVKIDDSDIEGVTAGEVGSYYTNGASPYIPLYSGGVTKIGQTFTLAAPTEIDQIMFGMNATGNPTGPVTMSIYATSVGAPTGSPIYTSWMNKKASELNVGGAFPYVFPTSKQTLAAGTYFAAIEFSNGDASNYVSASQGSYGSIQPGTVTTCYTYSGGVWHAQAYNIMYAVNPRAAIWLESSSAIFIKSHHMENQCGIAALIDNSSNCTLESLYVGGDIQIRRSKNITITGANAYHNISVDPYSSVLFTGTNYAIATTDYLQDYGASSYQGYFNTWTSATNPALNIRGNKYGNIFPNSLLDRWQADRPDGFGKATNMTWTKCGVGQVDTTQHPLTSFCARVEESIPTQENWTFGPLTGTLLDACRGRWVCWSWYMMFPSGQTFATGQYVSGSATVPAWAPSTQYNIGDAVNNGFSICVEPGISGSGAEPTWASAAVPNYQIDGTVVWLNCNTVTARGFDSSYSDDVWRRVSYTMYIPMNATASAFSWQWYGQAATDSTAYFAMPQFNYGTQPGQAPDPAVALTDSIAVGPIRIFFTTPADGTWVALNDIDLSTRKYCSTAGAEGSGAVWTSW